MTMEVNGAAVLAAVAKNPAAFAMSDAQVNALAMVTLIARFKDKTTGLEQVRSIAKTIGKEDFRLALDHLCAKDAAAMTKRLDPKNPELKSASDAGHREQIWKLAEGSIEPASVTAKAPSKKPGPLKETGAKTGAVMKSKALKPVPEPKVTKPCGAAKKT